MNVAIIDAELVASNKHRFPNLCCMKLSSYHKSLGDNVVLKTDYDNTDDFDKVYISKVFVNTEIPCEPEDKTGKNERTVEEWYSNNEFLKRDNIEFGGTGFFYDKAPPLKYEIEHAMPDYHLYDNWVNDMLDSGVKRNDLKYYLDYSIGYLTRKCFRHCYYCVNRNYDKVEAASNLNEFMDETRPKLCFLDDNFLGHRDWKELIEPVIATNKKFLFRQGLDERLLNKERIEHMSTWKYDGDFVFAFDNIEDKDIIESRLKLLRDAECWNKRTMFYVFCGCDKSGKYDDEFFKNDIRDLFERIRILNAYGALPYIMRFEHVYKTEFAQFYTAVASWCNQPSIFYSFSFDMFCKCKGMSNGYYAKYKRDVDGYLRDIGKKCSTWRAFDMVCDKYPDIASEYFCIKGDKHK